MTLIAITLCLIAERFISELEDLRNYSWFHRYALLLYRWSERFPMKATVILIILPVVLFTAWIDIYIVTNPIIQFVFSTAILLYSFGPKPFYSPMKEFCITYRSGKMDVALWMAGKLLNRELLEHEKKYLAYTIARSLFIIANDRILGPIFWFVLLGPTGAILFRLGSELRYQCKYGKKFSRIKSAVFLFHAILNWIPSRLTAFGYASMGNFITAVKRKGDRGSLFNRLSFEDNHRILYHAGLGALEKAKKKKESFNQQDIYDSLSLIRRTYAVMLGTIAMLTLGGWLL